MGRKSVILAWALGLGCSAIVHAQQVFEPPNWDRSLALLSANQADQTDTLRSLFDLARAGDSGATLQSLTGIGRDASLPMPAREQLLFRFTLGLSDLAPASVDHSVLDYLLAYEPRTLVPYQERPAVGVPLFNIRAAAHGIMNQWSRQTGAGRATGLISAEPETWLRAYLLAGPQQRDGFEDALDLASDAQLGLLETLALDQLPGQPELTVVAGKTALLSADSAGFQQVLIHGRGPAIARLLAASAQVFPAWENAEILQAALQSAPAGTAALAIAQLTPVLGDFPEVQALLLDRLSDIELGSAAALALARSATPATKDALAELAASSDELVSGRATMALELIDEAKSWDRQR
jgi:hypothetical protein